VTPAQSHELRHLLGDIIAAGDVDAGRALVGAAQATLEAALCQKGDVPGSRDWHVARLDEYLARLEEVGANERGVVVVDPPRPAVCLPPGGKTFVRPVYETLEPSKW